jgi:hypothetical protein
MRQSDDIDLERRLAELAGRLIEVPSVRDEVTRRVSSMSMTPSPLWFGVPIAVLLAVVGVVLAIHSMRSAQSPSLVVAEPRGPLLELDGLTIEQDFAAAINPRAILVGWSFRGGQNGGLRPTRANRSDRTREGFTEIPIRSDITRDGRTVCWSLFVVEQGDMRTADCPTVTVRVGAQQIGFGVSPHVYPAGELSRAVADTSRQIGSDVNMNEVRAFLPELR